MDLLSHVNMAARAEGHPLAFRLHRAICLELHAPPVKHSAFYMRRPGGIEPGGLDDLLAELTGGGPDGPEPSGKGDAAGESLSQEAQEYLAREPYWDRILAMNAIELLTDRGDIALGGELAEELCRRVERDLQPRYYIESKARAGWYEDPHEALTHATAATALLRASELLGRPRYHRVVSGQLDHLLEAHLDPGAPVEALCPVLAALRAAVSAGMDAFEGPQEELGTEVWRALRVRGDGRCLKEMLCVLSAFRGGYPWTLGR